MSSFRRLANNDKERLLKHFFIFFFFQPQKFCCIKSTTRQLIYGALVSLLISCKYFKLEARRREKKGTFSPYLKLAILAWRGPRCLKFSHSCIKIKMLKVLKLLTVQPATAVF